MAEGSLGASILAAPVGKSVEAAFFQGLTEGLSRVSMRMQFR